MPDGPFLIVEEVAALLRVPLSRVYEWTRRVGDDAIPRYRAGKRLVFRRDEVLAWFTETQRVGLVPDYRARGRNLRPGVRRGRRVEGRSDGQAVTNERRSEVHGANGTKAPPP
jgi:excisionase family DNA binding protein